MKTWLTAFGALPLGVLLLGACGGISVSDQELPDLEGQGQGGQSTRGLDGANGANVIGDSEPFVVELFGVDEMPYGIAYEEWLARYWQWLLSIPAAEHPREGSDCAAGQDGTVWFLATGKNGEVNTRSCTLPSGQPVLFAFNSALSKPYADCSYCTEALDGPDIWYGDFDSELERLADIIYPNEMFLEVDGESLKVGTEYFRATDVPFFTDVPEDDPYFSCTGVIGENSCGWTAGRQRPFGAVGYVAMLHPLAPGTYVLRFGASSESGSWATDVTYELTVTPSR